MRIPLTPMLRIAYDIGGWLALTTISFYATGPLIIASIKKSKSSKKLRKRTKCKSLPTVSISVVPMLIVNLQSVNRF